MLLIILQINHVRKVNHVKTLERVLKSHQLIQLYDEVKYLK